MFNGKLISLLFLISDLWITSISANDPIVATSYGKLKGRRLSIKGTDRAVDGYFSIPFARPPIGPLRFSPPRPAEPWKNVRDATAYPPICVQDIRLLNILPLMKLEIPEMKYSEDCLYLNIYTPANLDRNTPLPVMVWIHGGALVSGGASLYDGSALSAYEHVVVVTIQYRLAILGFFSTSDEHARGNWGFLDQVQALQWVQENIVHFGGDPNSVTIFGESAGAVSVSVLILSPMTKGLFHKAISESGVAFIPAIISTDPDEVAYVNNRIANLSNCEATNSVAVLNCMRKKTEEELLDVAIRVNNLYIPGVVDGVFLLKSPMKLLAKQEYHPVPYVIGVNNHEGGWLIPTLFLNISDIEKGMDKVTATKHLDYFPGGVGPEFNHLLIDEYMGDTEDPQEVRNGFLEIVGDLLFVVPSVKAARLHSESGYPVFMYEFQHRPSVYSTTKPDYVKSDHCDEIGFVFGFPFLNNEVKLIGEATEEEKTLCRTMMKYWANFARNGDPNGDGLSKWSVFDINEQYLEISLKQKMGKQLKAHRIQFWSKAFPERIHAVIEEKKEHTEL
ncbi:fatty acyl-CoA hydrolase precursor, medium chain-like [Ambystoma mexicanum]|uniref:fatty acyl-CoA hydrolase precursor, medium chain-like n=1 Tax=Ambystoma mexicanum TaxID=8296 RepID=UPI0037E8B2EA